MKSSIFRWLSNSHRWRQSQESRHLHLAKVGVEGSNPFARSNEINRLGDIALPKEGQGSALDKLGPSRLGVLRTTAPDPNFICSAAGISSKQTGPIHGSARMVQGTPAAQR